MNKIKIIDLLNMISKGEEVPKKIKFNNNVYKYHDKEHGYCRHYYDNTYICLDSEYNFFHILNDEVEIIEEEKKLPEKINVKGSYNSNKGFEDFNDNEKILVDKINDLLDYLENKEKGE